MTTIKMPCRPFELDTRTRVSTKDGNTNANMDFLETLLAGLNIKKYLEWLQKITYTQLLELESDIWELFEENPEGSSAGNYIIRSLIYVLCSVHIQILYFKSIDFMSHLLCSA